MTSRSNRAPLTGWEASSPSFVAAIATTTWVYTPSPNVSKCMHITHLVRCWSWKSMCLEDITFRAFKTCQDKLLQGKGWQNVAKLPKFFTEENCFVPSKATQTTHRPSFGRSTSRRVKGFWVKHRLCQILKVSMTTSRNSISRIWSNLHPKKDKWIGNLQSNLRPAAQVPTRIYQQANRC